MMLIIQFWSHQLEELVILLVRNVQCLLKKESQKIVNMSLSNQTQ